MFYEIPKHPHRLLKTTPKLNNPLGCFENIPKMKQLHGVSLNPHETFWHVLQNHLPKNENAAGKWLYFDATCAAFLGSPSLKNQSMGNIRETCVLVGYETDVRVFNRRLPLKCHSVYVHAYIAFSLFVKFVFIIKIFTLVAIHSVFFLLCNTC